MSARHPPPTHLSKKRQGACLALVDGMKSGVTIVVAALVLVCSGCGRVRREEFAPAVERLTSSAPAWVPRTEFARKLWSSEQRFYRERGHLPAWIDGDRPTPQFDALVRAISDADLHGLDPGAYGAAALQTARAQAVQGQLRHE